MRSVLNDIVAAHADTAIHVILDNLNTHKPRNDRWLKRHFHFTPTRASWLNQVENWFSILQGKSLHGLPSPRAHRCLHRNLQPTRQAIRLDQSQGPSKTQQSPFRGTVIPGTSTEVYRPQNKPRHNSNSL